MVSINEIRLGIAEFLSVSIIKNNYIYLDLWTILHLISGFILLFLIFKFSKNLKIYEKFILLFILVSFWEIFEVISPILWIAPESPLDIFYDFIIGMLGGSTYIFFKEKVNFDSFSPSQ